MSGRAIDCRHEIGVRRVALEPRKTGMTGITQLRGLEDIVSLDEQAQGARIGAFRFERSADSR